MKISVQDIPPDGMSWERDIKADELGVPDEYFKPLTPLHVKAFIEKADDEVFVEAEVKGRYETACARCLEPIKQERHDTYQLYFDITPETEFIEFGEDLRQELVISLTEILWCRPDCKGICQQCGANLNREKCGCRPGDKIESNRGINIK